MAGISAYFVCVDKVRKRHFPNHLLGVLPNDPKLEACAIMRQDCGPSHSGAVSWGSSQCSFKRLVTLCK